MSSVQERLQLKREPLDKWSIREQLCLASAVARSGDQNWISVSRALKPFGEPNRPPDWFHQKNCAAQYGMLLATIETPKRKKRISSVDTIETPIEHILKKLQAERLVELKNLLTEEKTEYQKLQEDMVLLQSGQVSEEQLDIWCKEIDEEEYKKEQEALVHMQWLQEREQKKQDIEKAWRPNKLPVAVGQKRKNTDSIDTLLESEHFEEIQQQLQQQMQHHQLQIQQNMQTQESPKPALSPLLTSLLKSPSQVQNTSILHTAITNRHVPSTNTNPMIASLLNSNTAVPVSPGIQQLVSTAIGQNQDSSNTPGQNTPIGNDILDDAQLTNIKLDDLANSILVQDGPLPEIKKEEVDDIISEIIENAGDIVDDPEQHLQLDGNGDININLELSDFDEEEIIQETEPPAKEYNKIESAENDKKAEDETSTNQQTYQQPSPQVVDPFEFQEDPVDFEPPSKPSGSIVKQDPNYVPHYQQQQQMSQNQSMGVSTTTLEVFEMEGIVEEVAEVKQEDVITEKLQEGIQDDSPDTKDLKELSSEEPSRIEKTRGSVEIVEVSLTEDEESEKEFNKSQIEDIVHSSKPLISNQDSAPPDEGVETTENEEEKSDLEIKLELSEGETEEQSKTEPLEEETTTTTNWTTTTESKECAPTIEETSEFSSDITSEIKKELNINTDGEQPSSEPTIITSELSENLFSEINIEIKADNTIGVKRDYSRTKKKEEKEFDALLAIEKNALEDSEFTEETFLDTITDSETKEEMKQKIKSENERSSSPWTEEEDFTNRSTKRRYSTPATPMDSVPNSPASSNAFYEDDRDHKNWKKSVMLVYNRLATNRYASLFLKPITEDQAPGYNSIVFRPMDLQTIKKNIENGSIRTTLEFKRDVMLMFTNAIMYNKTNDFVYNMALQMQQESLQPIEILLQAQQGEPSFRRETRTSESGIKRKRTFTDELLKVKKKRDD